MTRLALTLCLLAPLAASADPFPGPDELWVIGEAPRAERIEADIRALVDFGTRHTLSDVESASRGIGAARRWIHDEFEAISRACGGCLEVHMVRGVRSGRRIPEPTEIVNVVAILRGASDPQRVVMMSGDIDSRVTDPLNAVDDSPGANDNASGVAGVLEAARVLTRYRFRASIAFAALSGEEQGLYGGEILAEHARDAGWQLQAVLNNDMIGNIHGINGIVDNTTVRVFSEGTRAVENADEARLRRFTGGEVDSPSRNLARFVDEMDRHVVNLDANMVYRLDRFRRGGHHAPFNDAGVPAVRIMETNEHYDRQHQDLRVEGDRHFGDTIEFVDFEFAARATALNAVTLAALAWAPPPPAGVEIEGAVSPDTTLRWQQVPGAERYRVHWRETIAPRWQHDRPAGQGTEFTLRDVVIDNWFFGVSAESIEGHRSPVVFPGPAGAFPASGD